jgi:hypothetical protein
MPASPSQPSTAGDFESRPRTRGWRAASAAALYVLLIGSAALALWSRRDPQALPRELQAAVPWVFGLFVAAFAVYRVAAVRARRYPAFKAFFQVGVMVWVGLLLLPQAKARYETSGDPLVALLADPNPQVRTLAAELTRHRSEAGSYAPFLLRALRDPEPQVRHEAHRSLVAIGGADLGPPDNEEALEAWDAWGEAQRK